MRSCILVCVILVAVCLAHVTSTDTIFTASPGNVSALEERSLDLTWSLSLHPSNISYCIWQYGDCPEPSNCQLEDLIQYNNDERKRLDISPKHVGWTFTNKKSPCNGGISRDKATGHGGVYRLRVEDIKGTFYTSQHAVVTLYSSLSAVLNFNGMEHTVMLETADKDGIIDLEPASVEKGVLYAYSLNLNGKFPSDTQIMVSKYSGNDKQLYIEKCGVPEVSCEMELALGLENEVSLMAEIHTGIQGFPDNRITLPFNYDEVPGGGAAGIAFSVLFALFFVLAVVYIFLLFWFWRDKRYPTDDILRVLMIEGIWKKTKQEKSPEEDIENQESLIHKDEKVESRCADEEKNEKVVSQLQDDKRQLEKQLQQANTAATQYEKEKEILIQEKSALEAQIQKDGEEIEELKKQNEHLRQDAERVTNEINSLKTDSGAASKQKSKKGKKPAEIEMPEKLQIGSEDKTLTILAKVTGKSTPKVTWFKGPDEINHKSGEYDIAIDKKKNIYSLTLRGAALSGAIGIYECRAENKEGRSSKYCTIGMN